MASIGTQLRRLLHLAAAEGIGRAGALLATVITARFLGPASYGLFTIGYASGSIVGVVAEAGLGGYLTREGALRPRGLALEVRAVTQFRTALAVLGVLIVAALASVSGRSGADVAVITMLGFALALRSVSQTPLSVLVGMGDTGPSIRQQAIERGTLVLLLLLALPLARTPLMAAGAFLASVVAGGIASTVVWRARAPAPSADAVAPRVVALIRDTWPFLAAATCVAVYINAGAVVVAAFAGDHEAGAYGAAVSLYLAIVGLPTLLMRSVVKEMATAPAGPTAARAVAQSLFSATAIPGVVIVVAPDLARALLGAEFAATGALLRILALGACASFPAAYCVFALYVTHRERAYAAGTAAGVTAFLAVTAALAPRLGATGAAFGLVAAEVAGLVVVAVFAVRAGLVPRDAVMVRRALTAVGAGLLPVAASAVALLAVPPRFGASARLVVGGLAAFLAAIPGLRLVYGGGASSGEDATVLPSPPPPYEP